MACVLSDSTTIDADSQGVTGATFTVAAVCDDPTITVVIREATYNGTKLFAAPFTFTIVAGVSNLAIIIEVSQPGTVVSIVEVCPGGGTTVLRRVDMTDLDHTITGVRIMGVQHEDV